MPMVTQQVKKQTLYLKMYTVLCFIFFTLKVNCSVFE